MSLERETDGSALRRPGCQATRLKKKGITQRIRDRGSGLERLDGATHHSDPFSPMAAFAYATYTRWRPPPRRLVPDNNENNAIVPTRRIRDRLSLLPPSSISEAMGIF